MLLYIQIYLEIIGNVFKVHYLMKLFGQIDNTEQDSNRIDKSNYIDFKMYILDRMTNERMIKDTVRTIKNFEVIQIYDSNS